MSCGTLIANDYFDGAPAVRAAHREPHDNYVIEEKHMINLAITFLIIALIAGVLGFTGIAGISANIAWTLFVVGLILALVLFVTGRHPRL